MTLPSTEDPPSKRARRGVVWLAVSLGILLLGVGAAFWMVDVFRGRGNDDRPPIDPPGASGPPWFRDMTAAAGVAFSYRNGEEADQFTMLENLGGGVALLDYDGDGLLDIFLTGGGFFDGPDKTQIKGLPCKLYKNLGGWKFQDVTMEAGLDLPWVYTHGVAVADFDRDGWPDLVVTGYGKLALLHNESDGSKGRRFVDVTEQVGLRDTAWSSSVGWADLDGDGWPELYVCHYVNWSFANHPICPGQVLGVKRDMCAPKHFTPVVHSLFRNEGGKRFRDVAREQGFRPEGAGLGVVLADLNGDGKPDIYVANDTHNKFLFMNRGKGKLEEIAVAAGAAMDETGKPTGSMGIDVADYDGSGRPSLWVTNYQDEHHGLYRNLGNETFLLESHPAGIAAIGKNFVGFGTAFVDVDNDGWEDLVITNGHVLRFPPGSTVKQRPVLFHNVEQRGRRFFKDVSPQAGKFFESAAVGRGLAIGDLDNDGWPDVVVCHTNSPVVLLRNETAKATQANWLGVRLIGRENRDVVGSTLVLETDGRRLTRFVKGGGSYLSASDPRILFGLGSADGAQTITVRWSWGKEQVFRNLIPNTYWELREDQPEPKRLVAPAS
jgi:hypothetical protein